MKKGKKIFHAAAFKVSAGIALASFALVGAYIGTSAQNAKQLTVSYFDVGQGDSEMIRTPNQQNILIDGGPDRTISEKLGSALPFYDRTIDVVILTHAHADHLNGLLDVLRTYSVKKVVLPEMKNSTAGYAEFLKIIQEKHIPMQYAVAGGRFQFSPSVVMEILGPFDDEQSKTDINNGSVVARITYQKTSFLFTGDAEVPEEEHIVRDEKSFESQVLKVGHHGSKTSSSEEFLAAVHPSIAVVSVGEHNKYGHPSAEIIHRLEQNGITVYRTDVNGDIIAKSDGVHIQMTTEKESTK